MSVSCVPCLYTLDKVCFRTIGMTSDLKFIITDSRDQTQHTFVCLTRGRRGVGVGGGRRGGEGGGGGIWEANRGGGGGEPWW